MLTNTQNIFIVGGSVVGSLLFMCLLNVIWPRDKRREHNDQIGWQLTALGTTYAVILGFMLYAVWSNFGAADMNAAAEADSLVSLYRVAEGLPEPQRSQLQSLCKSYATVVIDREWPQMEQDLVPNETRALNREMWRTVTSIKSAAPAEDTVENQALVELAALAQARRTRVLQSSSRLPAVLWAVLVVGGILTVASACLFGAANATLHALQVFAFSLLIALGLVAIADINRPFQGTIHVSSFAFKRAQENMSMP